ncbi:MAG: TonB-dependent receptor [Campylobacteraceae bacterium]|nr:TonB-dependent receptor [Campylobacteraceae bacterium]
MNKNKLLISLSICACLALSTSANDKVNLGAVSVVDTALESYVKAINADRLDNLQASDIKDILKSMPSVIVDGNARYSQKVYVRGLEDKSSNITIDGAKLGGQLFHHSGDQTIDAEILKIGSIELGANSALSGSGVINGSFKYETKDPSDFLKDGQTFGAKISAAYQSAYERKSTSVAVFTKINDKLEFLALGNISKDGDIHISGKEKIKSKQSTLKSGLFKFVIKANEYNTIKLSYNKYSDGGKRQLSGEKTGNNKTDNTHNEITRDTYTLNYEYNPSSDLVKVEAKVFSNSQKLIRESLLDDNWVKTNGKWSKDGKIEQPKRTYENKTIGFDLRNTSIINNHMLTYGIENTKEEQSKKADALALYISGSEAGKKEASTVKGKGEIDSKAFYIEDEIYLDKLVLNIGARYDIHKLGGFYSGTFKQLSPKFKASYQLSENLRLRTGYGRIFKGPSLGETLMLNNSISQSTNTKAQTGHNIEIGLDYDLSNDLDTNSSKVGFTAYKYNVDNYMHPTKNGSIEGTDDLELWGFETVFTYSNDTLVFNASHTFSKGSQKNIKTGEKKQPKTANIHTFKLGADYKVNKDLSFEYDAEFVPGNEYQYSTDKSVKRLGYGVHNIAATYKLTSLLKGAKINFAIDNLFNKQYTKHTAFGTYFGSSDSTSFEVERNYKIKLSYTF